MCSKRCAVQNQGITLSTGNSGPIPLKKINILLESIMFIPKSQAQQLELSSLIFNCLKVCKKN